MNAHSLISVKNMDKLPMWVDVGDDTQISITYFDEPVTLTELIKSVADEAYHKGARDKQIEIADRYKDFIGSITQIY